MRVHRNISRQQTGRAQPVRRSFSLLIVLMALGVGYLLLTQLVPRLQANLVQVPGSVSEHWTAPIWTAASAANRWHPAALGVLALAAATAILLSIVSRATATIVHLAGICLCALDLVILVGALSYFYAQLLDNVL